MPTDFLQQSGLDDAGHGRLEFYLAKSEMGGFVFDSLRWIWDQECYQRIDSKHFDGGNGRWVSGLHSFDATTSGAIIKVAEYERAAKPRRVIYSWREWDLLNNTEIRYLQTCATPSDDYDPVDA